MTIDQREDFIVVAKHQNITRSAIEVHTSQPSLSTRIASLEKEVGCPLFERSNSGIKLNESGRIFLDHAQRIIALYHEGIRKSRQAKKVTPVKVVLDLASDYAQALPDSSEMPFKIVELEIDRPAIDAVASGYVDVAINSDYSQIPEFTAEAQRLGVTYIPIGMGSCFLAMKASNPLANKAALQRADLNGMTITVSAAHFDRWSKAVRYIIGPDVHLNFKLFQAGSYGDIALSDFEDALYICELNSTRSILERRRDIVVHDLLDGKPMTFPTALVCRTKDYLDGEENVGRFIRTFLNNQTKYEKENDQ